MLTRNDRLHLCLQFTVDILAVAANLLLLFAIKRRTPATMRVYSILLTNTAIIDTISAISGCLACTRVINGPDDGTIAVFIGPCSLICQDFCLLVHSIQAALLNQSTWFLLFSFFYRLYSLESSNHSNPTKAKTVIWIGCIASMALTTIFTVAYYKIAEEVDIEVSKMLHVEGFAAIVFPNVNSFRVAVSILPMALISPLLTIYIYFLRSKLLRKINQSIQKNRKYHNDFAKTLTYQSLLPLGSILGTIYWSTDKYLALSSELPQRILMMITALICFTSPIINLLYLPAYRGMFQPPKRKVVVLTVGS